MSLVNLLEAGGVLLIYPFVQVLTTGPPGGRSGAVHWLWQFLGEPSRNAFLLVLGLAVVTAFAVKALLAVTISAWQFNLIYRQEATAAGLLVSRFLRMPFVAQVRRHSSQLSHEVRHENENMHALVLMGLVNAASEGTLLLILAITVTAVAPYVALFLGAYVIVLVAGYTLTLGRRVSRLGRQNDALAAEVQHQLQEIATGFKEIVTTESAPYFVDRFKQVRFEWADVRRNLMLGWILPRYYLEVGIVTAVVAVALLSNELYGRSMVIATVGLISAVGFRLMPSLARLLVASGQVRAGLAEQPPPVPETTDRAPSVVPHKFAGAPGASVEFRDVSVGYEPNDPVLEHVNVHFRANTFTAIVGPSGSGKTTLANLVLGLLTPVSGRLLIDGSTLAAGSLAEWRQQVGYVPQDVFLVAGTVADNIAFGVPPSEIDHERVRQVIAECQLTDVVSSLPQGLGTRVGERGALLSGGQRQRIGIARALYRRPRFLVLDEATSALDSVSEAAIADTVRRLRATVTLMVIAHRLSTVADADLVVLVDQRTVVVSDSFSELAATTESFANLLDRYSESAREITQAKSRDKQ